MGSSGCPAFIPEGRTSFTRTRRGTPRVRNMRADEARDLSVSRAEYIARLKATDMNMPPIGGMKRTEVRKNGKVIISYKKDLS
jgi:hypothetical protein